MGEEMPETMTVTACLVIIGNEILSGRTIDANLPYLARALVGLGIELREVRIIADERDAIIGTINEVRARHDYVFTTGGIGPTHDDITSECVAAALGVRLAQHPEALRRLQSHYANPADLNPARLRMTYVPEGATLIDNPISKAPGFRIANVFVLAGVPRIMQAMFEGLAPGLRGGPRVLSRTLTGDLAEGRLAGDLRALQERFPTVQMGSYPYFQLGKVGTSIVLRSADAALLDAAASELQAIFRAFGVEPAVEAGD